MTAKDNTTTGGKDVTDDELTKEIVDHGDATTAKYEPVKTAGPVTEVFAIPKETEINISGEARDSEPGAVFVNIYTGSNEPRITMKQVLTPDEALALARRLEKAANVAQSRSDDK